ncbi:MAG: lysophospholipid acyltransferase family protein [Owenweeksia sp.]|nr:lysophospholipid acyltransferase family protein [Owenweeksia sp.]
MQVLLTYIWRAWFYVCIAVAIILLFPFIFITSQRSHWYPSFFVLARVWAWLVLLLAGFWPRAIWLQKPSGEQPYIICPNHTSMVDIMLTLALFPHCFLFIGKSELTRLPLFGYFYRKTNILVDRKSMRSRQQAFEKGAEKLKEGVGLCIFPEGGVPDPQVDLARFKVGAFRLAAEHHLRIIPVSFPDNKRHLPYDFKKGIPRHPQGGNSPRNNATGPGQRRNKKAAGELL